MAYEDKYITDRNICRFELIIDQSTFSCLLDNARKHNCTFNQLIVKYILDSMDREEFSDDWTHLLEYVRKHEEDNCTFNQLIVRYILDSIDISNDEFSENWTQVL